jgi:hypothetical protein
VHFALPAMLPTVLLLAKRALGAFSPPRCLRFAMLPPNAPVSRTQSITDPPIHQPDLLLSANRLVWAVGRQQQRAGGSKEAVLQRWLESRRILDGVGALDSFLLRARPAADLDPDRPAVARSSWDLGLVETAVRVCLCVHGSHT